MSSASCKTQTSMTQQSQHLLPTATSSPLNSPVFNPSPCVSSIVIGAFSSSTTTNTATNMAADTLVLTSSNAAVISAYCSSVSMSSSLSLLLLLVLGPDSTSGSASTKQPAAIVSSGVQSGDGCSDSTAQELQSALATALFQRRQHRLRPSSLSFPVSVSSICVRYLNANRSQLTSSSKWGTRN